MSALQGWRPWEPTAQAMLLPWQQVWSTKEWAAVTDRVIVPPLEAAMHELLCLNPLEPDTRSCDWCLAWTGSLSTAQLAGTAPSISPVCLCLQHQSRACVFLQ